MVITNDVNLISDGLFQILNKHRDERNKMIFTYHLRHKITLHFIKKRHIKI